MKILRRGALASCAILGFAAGLSAPRALHAQYLYVATTAAPQGTKQGTVRVGNLTWKCKGNRCSTGGPWVTPSVKSCNALARVVGPLRSYGRAGETLSAAQLAECNRGVPGVLDPGKIPVPTRPLPHRLPPSPSPSGGRDAGASGDVPLDAPNAPPASAAAGSMTERGIVTDDGPQTPTSLSVDPTGAMYFTYVDGSGTKLGKLSAAGTLLWLKQVPFNSGSNRGVAVAGNDGVLAVSPQHVIRYDAAGTQEYSYSMGQSAGGGVHTAYDRAGGVYVAFLPYPNRGRVLKRVDRHGRLVFSTPPFDAGPSAGEVAIATDDEANVFAVTGGNQVTVRKWGRDGTLLWTAPVTNVYGVKKHVMISEDGAGGVFVAWSDARRHANAADAFVQALDATGAARWTANGVEIARDPQLYMPVTLAPDSSGGVYVGYASGSETSEIVRVIASGEPKWAAPAALGTGGAPQLASDGSGVFAVARTRGDGGPCLIANRFDGDGVAAWSPAKTIGTCMHQVGFFVGFVRAQPVVLFTDMRSGYPDVYLWQ